MLLTLWLYAISRGISSAREIERLSQSDDAFDGSSVIRPSATQLFQVIEPLWNN